MTQSEECNTQMKEDYVEGCHRENYMVPHICPVATGEWCKDYVKCKNLEEKSMLEMKLNEHSAEDMKEIEKLRAMGVPEDVIQMGYNNTQVKRENESLVGKFKEAIKRELEEYAENLEVELTEKYKEEFEKRLREHRRKIVLDVVETIEIEAHHNWLDNTHKIQITI